MITKSQAKKWIKWLRGEGPQKFRQGKYALVDSIENPRYCCIGVLGRSLGREDSSMVGKTFLGKDVLSKSIQEDLAELNDGKSYFEKGLSFKQIANMIEKMIKTGKLKVK